MPGLTELDEENRGSSPPPFLRTDSWSGFTPDTTHPLARAAALIFSTVSSTPNGLVCS